MSTTPRGAGAPPPKVLVTGGAGYIGSHACEALAGAGFVPVAYDNLSRGHRSLVRYGPLEEGDIRDLTRLAEVFARHRPVAVMHFAALAYVGESVSDPEAYYVNNVEGGLALLQATRQSGVDCFVFSSTCAIYGQSVKPPISEDAPCDPVSPYGHSKLMVERILQDFDRAYRFRSVSLRYFNACGAHPSGEIGEMHDPEPHLIPRALMAVHGDIKTLDVFGTDYPTPDGTAIRDYIHVCDLADAHVAALRYLLDGGATTAVNLGTGHGHSVLDILRSVQRVTGHEVPIRQAGRRPGDPPMLVADPTRARDTFGFRAQWTDLDKVIGSAWRWHTRQGSKADVSESRVTAQ